MAGGVVVFIVSSFVVVVVVVMPLLYTPIDRLQEYSAHYSKINQNSSAATASVAYIRSFFWDAIATAGDYARFRPVKTILPCVFHVARPSKLYRLDANFLRCGGRRKMHRI
jgi:hypothetical protein